jgi:hypothetical protein
MDEWADTFEVSYVICCPLFCWYAHKCVYLCNILLNAYHNRDTYSQNGQHYYPRCDCATTWRTIKAQTTNWIEWKNRYWDNQPFFNHGLYYDVDHLTNWGVVKTAVTINQELNFVRVWTPAQSALLIRSAYSVCLALVFSAELAACTDEKFLPANKRLI